MWRIPGLLSRALNRFHVANVQGCVHGEAEALNPSSLIPLGQNAGGRSYSSQSSGDHGGQNGQGQKRKGKGNFQFCAGQLPQYTVLDAFRVGAAAVFFLQLARQISFHCSTSKSREESRPPQRTYLEQILASLSQCNTFSVKNHIVPKAVQPCTWSDLRLQSEGNRQDADASLQSTSTAPSTGRLHVSERSHLRGHSQAEDFLDISSSCERDTREATTSAQESLEVKEDNGESLQVAASRLLDVTETSVPTVLNIFGIVSARDSGDYTTAFKFFRESAAAGYSKAQYNTAVCYEKGKGVTKDMRKAQAYLGVFYSKESHSDPQKAATYFRLAAENGDVQSLYNLGVCYERGFGVPASRQEAVKHYERAAKSGHEASQQKLVELRPSVTEGLRSPLTSLRTTTSSPCLPVLERMNIRLEPNFSTNTSNLGLPHSLSTGNLAPPSESGSYLLAPIHMTGLAPPMTSLRAIGVG
ncbi:hypothetical protein GDO81_010884 [Engystomops pustulosus]|uniref:Death ligand signal enhancer n=1 Tax=Engystomops pustulosus TaxID=76066 RepID=A0AAV7C385_ENGPU|nr:hypothetical protein GDO81_010884 [Engystomops pustulosus]